MDSREEQIAQLSSDRSCRLDTIPILASDKLDLKKCQEVAAQTKLEAE